MSRLRWPSWLSWFCAVIVILALAGCADIDVRGRAVSPPPPVVEDVAETPEETQGSALESPADLEAEIPEELAFTDDGPTDDALTDAALTDDGGPLKAEEPTVPPVETASTTYVRTFGAQLVDVGYTTPLLVAPGKRISFTSSGWAPGAVVVVHLRGGQSIGATPVELGSFTATGTGTAFGFVEMPTDLDVDEARLQWTSSNNGVRQADTIMITTNDDVGRSGEPVASETSLTTSGDVEATVETCRQLANLESMNREIEEALTGASINTDEDALLWWPQYQAQVRGIGPTIDALRQGFLDTAAEATEPLAGQILGANEDDRILLSGLIEITADSDSVEEFEERLGQYQADPVILALERDHRIFIVDSFTQQACGFGMDSFTS